MDEVRAHEILSNVLTAIDAWGELYYRRWGKGRYNEDSSLDAQVREGIDLVRQRTRLARDIIVAMDEPTLAARVVEHEEGMYGSHPFNQARTAIVEAIAVLAQREELASIVGPIGPRLVASELHPTIWGSASALWDDGHSRAAVQTASSALEGLLQSVARPGVSGEQLAALFSCSEPTVESPRLRLRDLDPDSKTWRSAHEGAAALVRGAFLAVRNLVSHPGWPEPTPSEGLEMLAVLSYVARLFDRSHVDKLA